MWLVGPRQPQTEGTELESQDCRYSSMVMALWLQTVTVWTDKPLTLILVDRQATYTDTSTRISSIKIALCLQSIAVVDRQATFTDTSTKISSMDVALCLQSVAVVD